MTIDNLLNFWHATVTYLKGVLVKIFHNLCPVGFITIKIYEKMSIKKI